VLTLASRSPQRKAILEQLGIEFRVEPADVEELTDGDPREVVVENAARKARAVEGELVLGADTEVFLDGRIFGKAAASESRTPSRRSPSRSSATGWSTGTSRAASGATAPAPTRSRAAGPRSSRR
jgi:septum formation protein